MSSHKPTPLPGICLRALRGGTTWHVYLHAAWVLIRVAPPPPPVSCTIHTVPSGETLQGVGHAGLWLSCSSAVTTPTDAPSSASLNAVANSTIAASIADVRRDLNFARLRTVQAPGCSGSGTTFENLNGRDFVTLLTAVRALALCFLGLGLCKVVALLLGQCCRLVRGPQDADDAAAGARKPQRARLGSSACCCVPSCGGPCGGTASVINAIQAACGWAVFGIMLYVIIETAEGAPAGHRDVRHVWGWSFWLFLAALLCSSFAGGALCCV